MENEPIRSDPTDRLPRYAIAALALVLIGFEVFQISYNYRVIESLAPTDSAVNFEFADWLAVAHGVRIALIATLLTGWRWSLWVTALSYLIVYVPNPWISGTLMNSVFSVLILLAVAMIAWFFDKRLLYPWRTELQSPEVSQPQGLISVLLDQSAEYGDRHDAAMDLAKYDEPEAWEALTRVKNDPNEEPDIVEEAEQSLLEIHRRRSES